MFDICGHHFIYDDFDSSEYGLIFANMDTSRLNILQSEQKVNTVYSKKNNMHYMINTQYNIADPTSVDAEIFTFDGSPIGESYLHNVEKSLFCSQSFKKLYAFESYDEDIEEPYVKCIFINPERIETLSGVVGYKFTMVLDSVMMYDPEITETFTFTSGQAGTKTFSVTLDTDINDYTYPNIRIQVGSLGGDIAIYNVTDDSERLTEFSSLPPSSLIVMDSAINYIPKIYYDNFSGRNFIRLLDGENTFLFTGDVTSITITYQNRKYL